MKQYILFLVIFSTTCISGFAGISLQTSHLSHPSDLLDKKSMTDLNWGDGGDDDYFFDYEDDFYYSRRIRRFHSTRSSRVSWSYYDPYFTNDVYYVNRKSVV